MKSILSNEKVCYVCGTPCSIHKHHCFFGVANRKLSEKYGCWVYLCSHHHNMSNEGVHFNKSLDIELKQLCQEKWEDIYGTRDEFRKLFGKSYL